MQMERAGGGCVLTRGEYVVIGFFPKRFDTNP